MDDRSLFSMSRKRKSPLLGMTSATECKKFARMHLLNPQQVWVTFGGLGADLSRNDLIRKRECAVNTRKYSDGVRVLNKKCPHPVCKVKNLSDTIPPTPTSRQRALEFASRIPRPAQRAKPALPRRPLVESDQESDAIRVSSLISRFTELNICVQDIRTRYQM